MSKDSKRPPRDYYDQELIGRKAEAKARIKELLAEGTVEAEQEFVGLLKAVKPDLTAKNWWNGSSSFALA